MVLSPKVLHISLGSPVLERDSDAKESVCVTATSTYDQDVEITSISSSDNRVIPGISFILLHSPAFPPGLFVRLLMALVLKSKILKPSKTDCVFEVMWDGEKEVPLAHLSVDWRYGIYTQTRTDVR